MPGFTTKVTIGQTVAPVAAFDERKCNRDRQLLAVSRLLANG